MPRLRTPHPIEAWLREEHGSKELTCVQYGGVAKMIDQAQGDAEAWLAQHIAENDARLGHSTPRRTVLVWRSAVNYYLQWKGQVWGGNRPSLHSRPEGTRASLTADQLALFCALVEQEPEPFRTMLQLLLRTGLRSFELCKLRDREYLRDERILRFVGRSGAQRDAPLTAVAQRLLDSHASHVLRGSCQECEVVGQACDHLFWTLTLYGGEPRRVITRDLRAVTERMVAENTPVLQGLCPHVLRHTTGAVLRQEGVSAETIQAILGHQDMRTLTPYLKPLQEDRRKALELMG